MPLLDHFHAPIIERRPWESFHTTWATALDSLNQDVFVSVDLEESYRETCRRRRVDEVVPGTVGGRRPD